MAVGDIPEQPRVTESISQAWTNMWPAFWVLLGMSLIVMIAGFAGQPSNFLPSSAHWSLELGLAGAGLVVSIFVLGPLGLGVVKAHLAATRGEAPEFGDLGYGFSRYPQAVLLTLLTTLIVIGGFILLIIPGIYLSVKLMFVNHRFINDELDAMDAIKASFEDTQGIWWRTFGLALMSIPLYIAGLLALGVGVFVAGVLVSQMGAVYWRSVEGNST